MANISLNQEPVTLVPGKQYIVIDTLYITDINARLDKLDPDNLLAEIKTKVFGFPKTNTPFAVFTPSTSEFKIDQIVKVYGSNVVDETVFSTDTALIAFIQEPILKDFINGFSYSDLVNHISEPIDVDYWESKTGRFPKEALALVLAPGIDQGVDFDGSGRYKLVRSFEREESM